MVVGVGSLSDPPNMQGLSHYLEHMLFMGSEQFPDENDYDSFLSKNGGGSNAYTELVCLCCSHSTADEPVVDATSARIRSCG